jgi:hypothetical protein
MENLMLEHQRGDKIHTECPRMSAHILNIFSENIKTEVWISPHDVGTVEV